MLKPLAILTLTALASLTHAQTCPTWTIPQPPVDDPTFMITELIRHDNKLVARGQFTTISNAPEGFVSFDGSTWTSLGTATPGNSVGGERNTIASWGGRLYAAGRSNSSPISTYGGIWSGSSWTQWGSEPTAAPLMSVQKPRGAFPLGDGTLLVDGRFDYPNEEGTALYTRRLAKWNGSRFVPLSTTQFGPRPHPDSLLPSVTDAVKYDGKILLLTYPAISTGNLWNSNNIPCPSGLVTFDGSGFAPFPAPALNGGIYRMVLFNGELYVCGSFTATADNSITLNHMARWTGTQWAKCGNGLNRTIEYMTVGNDGTGEKIHLLTTGTTVVTAYNDPNSTTTDTVNFRGVVRFDGARFTSYGAANASGYTTASAYAAETYDPGTGPALYVAGLNFNPGSLGTTNFARRGPAPSPDTDGDGLLDTWELNGIDLNCDGITDLNLPGMGANWQKKDIFVEVDSMNGRAPHIDTLNRVVAAFASANVDNVNGTQGINLHLIVDPADQSIPLQDFPNIWPDFHAIKAERFGNSADRTGPNRQAILDAKRLVFRYSIFADRFGGINSSGNSELPGNDFMVTLGTFSTPGGTPDQQAATFMHELGHTLGLYHGGHQVHEYQDLKYNFKPNYHSIMNYSWQLSHTRPGWTLDYSREVLPDLDELHLDETIGIGGEPGALALSSPGRLTVPESGPVDWNRDGDFDEDVVANINNMTGTHNSLDTLTGFHDWPNLFYSFRNLANYANGASPDVSHTDNHLTRELQALLDAAYTPACPADLGLAGGLPGADGDLDNNDFIAFINYFFAADPHADLGIAGGLPGADSQFDNNDFIAFISLYFEGC